MPRLSIRFIPEQQQLSALIRQLRAMKKAYPLSGIALLFSSKPEYCDLKIECGSDAGASSLFQCKTCRMVALDRTRLVQHAVRTHFDEYFEKEEREGEAPAGQFVCIARCGVSGVLLGPPNHHSYAAKLQETHRTRCPHLSVEEYKRRVEMIHDPALIEQWKNESRVQTVYRRRPADAAVDPMAWPAAESLFVREVVPSLIVETRRAILPLKTAQRMEDPILIEVVRQAWRREGRQPRSLAQALRAALQNKHFQMFRNEKGVEFVTAIVPTALDTTHAVPFVREIVAHVAAHPACARSDLLQSLRPDAAADSQEASDLAAHLGWLVDKGHLVEFADGALLLPPPAAALAPPQVAPQPTS